jgi:hypothetical protein
VKQPANYADQNLATIFTLGIYMFWWLHNQMDQPNSTSAAPGIRKTTSYAPQTRSAEPKITS